MVSMSLCLMPKPPPILVIKTRLQTRPAPGTAAVHYRGIAHCAQEIYRNEGAKAFFKGAGQRCFIIAPLFGITLLVGF
jgi:solute carrier family 25 aspartate/glutamate transporter 12/13